MGRRRPNKNSQISKDLAWKCPAGFILNLQHDVTSQSTQSPNQSDANLYSLRRPYVSDLMLKSKK